MNVYTLTDISGAARTITGSVEISDEQRIDTLEESEMFGGAQLGDYVPCEVQIPYSALDGFDDALLARWRITREVVADPEPPTVRRQIPKSTVSARVDVVGKLGAVFAIIQSSPLLFSQWFAPDWPNVYADDAGMLQVLAAAGLTADEVAQVTA